MKQYCPRVPYVLVGTKTDLRSDPEAQQKLAAAGGSFITPAQVIPDFSSLYRQPTLSSLCLQGETLAAKIKAVAYVECSAKKMENVSLVFNTAVRATFGKKGGCCSLM